MDVISSTRLVDVLNSIHYPHYISTPLIRPSMATGIGGFRSFPIAQNASSPGSQESLSSIASSKAAASSQSLMAASSNVSQMSVNTSLTSPASPIPISAKENTRTSTSSPVRMSQKTQPLNTLRVQNRLRTPEEQLDASSRHTSPTSPLNVTTPVNGVKRTANGTVKNWKSSKTTSPVFATVAGRPRTASVSSTSSKAGEAAAQLKTRLAYAMAKVQHGWEHKSMAEVEQLAVSLSPKPLTSPRDARPLTSPRFQTLTAKSAGDRLPQAQIPMYDPSRSYKTPMSPPAKRRSGEYATMMSDQNINPRTGYVSALAPPAEIGQPRHKRRVSFTQTSPRQQVAQTYGHYGSPPSRVPTTPKAVRRPAHIRTSIQTAQDEQDAMDALMLMGSPTNGGQFPRSSQQSPGHGSPQRTPVTKTDRPRQALQYRSDSNDSITRSSESGYSSAGMADRSAILEQIEAEP